MRIDPKYDQMPYIDPVIKSTAQNDAPHRSTVTSNPGCNRTFFALPSPWVSALLSRVGCRGYCVDFVVNYAAE